MAILTPAHGTGGSVNSFIFTTLSSTIPFSVSNLSSTLSCDLEDIRAFFNNRGLLASNGILTSLQRSIQRDILTEKGSSSLNNSEGTTLADVDGTTVKVTVLGEHNIHGCLVC